MRSSLPLTNEKAHEIIRHVFSRAFYSQINFPVPVKFVVCRPTLRGCRESFAWESPVRYPSGGCVSAHRNKGGNNVFGINTLGEINKKTGCVRYFLYRFIRNRVACEKFLRERDVVLVIRGWLRQKRVAALPPICRYCGDNKDNPDYYCQVFLSIIISITHQLKLPAYLPIFQLSQARNIAPRHLFGDSDFFLISLILVGLFNPTRAYFTRN